MFFEDEKDIIREGADIHIDEDGTVTWDDVLDTQDEVPSLNSKTNVEDSDELIQVVEDEEEINDQDLLNMLNDAQADSIKSTNKTTTNQNTQENYEDFDLDGQLSQVVLEENKTSGKEAPKPRKAPSNGKSSSSMPLLIAILFGLLVAGGIYYGKIYIEENGLLNQISQATQNNLEPAQSIQNEMNNITSEELAQRQTEQNIPVVNEEEAQELEAQEEVKEEKVEEKKQVVKVIPTGRINPFMPTPKYLKTSVPDASIEYDKSGIPKPPESYGTMVEETNRLMSIIVSGIMYDNVKPSAIITYDNNDYFVQKGDKLDDYRIVEIAKNHVSIALGKNVYRANIGEEFKVTSNFEGSAQYIPASQGGGRHYQTVVSEGKSSSGKTAGNLRYVSEDDIEIKTK